MRFTWDSHVPSSTAGMSPPSPQAVRSLHRHGTKHLQSMAHWAPRVSLKKNNFLKTSKFLVTNCPATSTFSSNSFSQTQAEDSVVFFTILCVFQFMTSSQIPPELTIFSILKSRSSWNYFSLPFFVIQLFCTTRTWGQDIILIRDAFKPLKLSHFVSSFSLKCMRHQPLVCIFCSKYHQVLRWMFFHYFCFLEL